jgi:hypothetical protein
MGFSHPGQPALAAEPNSSSRYRYHSEPARSWFAVAPTAVADGA